MSKNLSLFIWSININHLSISSNASNNSSHYFLFLPNIIILQSLRGMSCQSPLDLDFKGLLYSFLYGKLSDILITKFKAFTQFYFIYIAFVFVISRSSRGDHFTCCNKQYNLRTITTRCAN